MNTKPTLADDSAGTSTDDGTDWAALLAMPDEEAEQAARDDPDAKPMSDQQLLRARRVGLAGTLRLKLGLSRLEFAQRFHVPIETLRGWERGTLVPDAVAVALLRLIDADPAMVEKTLADERSAAAE